LEKEEPVRLEDKKLEYEAIIFLFPQEYEVIPTFASSDARKLPHPKMKKALRLSEVLFLK